MSRYDETHDDGDLRSSIRREIFDVLYASKEALRPMQIQYRLGRDRNLTVSVSEIQATLNWMVNQPQEEISTTDWHVVVTHNNKYGALPVYVLMRPRAFRPEGSRAARRR